MGGISGNLNFRKFKLILLEFLANIYLLQFYTSQWPQKRSGYVVETCNGVNCASSLFGENKCSQKNSQTGD